MKARKFPDTLFIVSMVLLLFVVLTWIIPAGEFQRETVTSGDVTRQVINPETFEYKESNGQLLEIFMAPLEGLVSAADIVAFVLLIGGAFQVIHKTGTLNAGLFSVIEISKKSKSMELAVIPFLMLLFSIGGATFGMAEEVLVFILVTIPLAQALGYDPVVGIAIPFIGAGVGFAGAFMNPFTVGIAQGIAEISPLFSGWEYRLIVWLIFTVLSIIFVSLYASKIKKDPGKSVTGQKEYDFSLKDLTDEERAFNSRRKIIMTTLLLSLVMLIVGANFLGWYISEFSGLFLALGIASAAIYNLSISDTVSSFTEGAKSMILPALIIGFAKGAMVIAEDGMIIDTILYYISNFTSDLPRIVSAEIILFIQAGLNFFVPSGSGQAALTIPIIAPLSDVLDISRQTAVLAYQFGDGISNLIIPTSGVTMGILEIAKIPYNKWLKWILPLMILLYITAMILLAIATEFNVW